jgi:hypothetical protein
MMMPVAPTSASSRRKVRIVITAVLALATALGPATSSSAAGDLFSDAFEGDVSGWTTTGLWHRVNSSLCTAPILGFASPTQSFYYGEDPNCHYVTGSNTNSGTLTSPDIDVLDGKPVRIAFNYFTETECAVLSDRCPPFDKTSLEVSFDGASTWTEIWSTSLTTLIWTPLTVDVTPTSTSMRLRFKFDTVDGFDNDHIGTLVDDPSVTLDSDGDGQADTDETACGSDPNDASDVSPDLDSDDLPDCVDPDRDGDGVANDSDAFPDNGLETVDTDADGTGNNADTDDDGDLQSDADETACGSDPLSASSKAADLDADNTPDCVDPDKDGDGTVNDTDAFPADATETTDTDNDGTGNNADSDDDGDLQSDADETACGSDPLSASSKAADLDADNTPDCVDPDKDGDGTVNDSDAFPNDGSETLDTDGDQVGNNADTDDDGDSQSDADEIACGSDPLRVSSTSADLDADNSPDCVDPDRDGDGTVNESDAFPDDATETVDTDSDGTGNNADTDDDGDGQSDADETACGSDPLDATSTSSDLDEDGVADCVDPAVGTEVAASAASVESRSLKSGSYTRLAADDDQFYEVNSTTVTPASMSWYAVFRSVPNDLTGLIVTYRGKNSRTCNQTLYIRNFTSSTWVNLGSQPVGTTETPLSTVTPGTAGDYVMGTSGRGQVRLRVRCAGAAGTFFSSADLMRIAYLGP